MEIIEWKGMEKNNLKGKCFGYLNITGYLGNGKWLVFCNGCNKEKIMNGRAINEGKRKSCGCKRTQSMTETKLKGKDYNINKRLKGIHRGMIYRCNKKTDMNYSKYGAKGVKVCKEWLDYDIFYNWAINNGYDSNLTLERNDVFGNYEPNNCCWITIQEQQKNKRNSPKNKNRMENKK